MRALFARTSVVCGLFLVLAAAGNAQMSQQYRAEIPFDFQVKNTHFAAGSYSLGPVGAVTNSGGISLRQRSTGESRLLGLSQMGEGSWSGKGKLTFARINGVYTLTQVETPTFAVKVAPAKRQSALAMQANSKMETVVVFLEN